MSAPVRSHSGGIETRVSDLERKQRTAADASLLLAKASNLSDVASVATARTNLGGTSVGSALFTAADMAAANSVLGYAAAWTSVAAGATSASGTLTNASGAYRYLKIGRLVHLRYEMSIINAGTGAGAIFLTAPFAAAVPSIIAGKESALTGNALVGSLTGTTITVTTYNNGSTIATGALIRLNGVYEAAS